MNTHANRPLSLAMAVLSIMSMAVAWAEQKPRVPLAATHADVAYDVHERTVLDFWQAEGEGPRPLLMVIHGGGWLGGDKSRFKHPEHYLKHGISVAAISYRLAKTDPLPTPVTDAARALQFLRSKADEWNIDKSRVVLTGDSAGGCSSLWIACQDEMAQPNAQDPVLRESTRVLGAAVAGAQVAIEPKVLEDWVGPYGLHGMIHGAVGEPNAEALKANAAKHAATLRKFSPIQHLSADDPAIWMGYDADLTLPAKSYGHAIHHGIFGVKFQEKSKEVGHNQVYLSIGKKYQSEYRGMRDFIIKTLTKK